MKRALQATRLRPLDRGFLYLDWLGQPFHVGFLNVFTPPPDASRNFVRELAERLRAYPAPTWPFDQRLQGRLGESWIEDVHFDIDHHVVRLAVASPGSMKNLMHLVSELHTMPLDRTRPLWRLYLIEGMSDGRIATYCKVHHAFADGVAGTRLMLRSMSIEKDQDLPAPWATPSATERPDRQNGASTVPAGGNAGLLGGLRAVLNALPAAASEAYQTLREVADGNPATVGGAQAPACILNQRISDSREIAARSYSLPRIKALCEAFNCSTNDIVLALCASALRHFLLDEDALPQRPLIALVPMSKRSDESVDGNQIVPLLVNLGTDQADPLDRLRVICRSTDRSIERFVGRNAAEAYGYTLATSSRGLINQIFRPAGGNLAFNVVISKVSGPRSQMYWQGCRLDGMYPVSVVMDGLALNITVAMRDQWLDFGLVACRRSLPRVQRLLVYLECALNELESRAVCGAVAKSEGGKVHPMVRSGTRVPIHGPDVGRRVISRATQTVS